MRLLHASIAVALLFSAADASARPQRPVRNTTLRLNATAYCERGRTKSGVHAQHGIVAADPRRLPIGTRIRIVAPGKPYAGDYTVMDTGSGIKGRELDIFMTSCARARKFGRRSVEVKVLRERAQR